MGSPQQIDARSHGSHRKADGPGRSRGCRIEFAGDDATASGFRWFAEGGAGGKGQAVGDEPELRWGTTGCGYSRASPVRGGDAWVRTGHGFRLNERSVLVILPTSPASASSPSTQFRHLEP